MTANNEVNEGRDLTTIRYRKQPLVMYAVQAQEFYVLVSSHRSIHWAPFGCSNHRPASDPPLSGVPEQRNRKRSLALPPFSPFRILLIVRWLTHVARLSVRIPILRICWP